MPGKGAGSSGDNFELDIQEGGFTGSGPANQNFAWHLHTPSGWFGGVVDTGIDLTAAFHTYAINWDPGKSITWYLDGKQIAQLTSAQAPIPNEPMELNMNMGVANSNAAGWHTALDSSTPSSMPMQVDAIQLYQKAGSGETVTGANVTPGSTPPSTTPPTTTPPVTTPPTTHPAVTQATASPGTGVEHVGDKIALTLAFNEAVTVTGKPTLTLNDGGIATYVSGSGTGKLTFETTVAAGNTSTSGARHQVGQSCGRQHQGRERSLRGPLGRGEDLRRPPGRHDAHYSSGDDASSDDAAGDHARGDAGDGLSGKRRRARRRQDRADPRLQRNGEWQADVTLWRHRHFGG
jgi:Glycosyl hydrolases family 16